MGVGKIRGSARMCEIEADPMNDGYQSTADYLARALNEIAGFDERAGPRVLDFGCGSGQLIGAFVQRGIDAHGCDVPSATPRNMHCDTARAREIALSPYRIPFDDQSFDAIVSTSVLEHAQNTEECFREMHRVLKPGGYAMHLLPGKWYLPSEPHIYVPLANFFWPHVPRWWLGLWALLGVRNEYQQSLDWRTVRDLNYTYCQTGLCYLPSSRYHALSKKIFGDYSWRMDFYLAHSPGGVAAFFRRLPLKRISGWLARNLRMGFLVLRKQSG